MGGDVIKFNKAKKALTRQKREAQAAENRIKFGRTKAEKHEQNFNKRTSLKKIDGHKLSSEDIKTDVNLAHGETNEPD